MFWTPRVSNIEKQAPSPLLQRVAGTSGKAWQELRARRPHVPDGPRREQLWQQLRVFIVGLGRPRNKDVALPHWVHLLVGLSDDGLRIPGTRVRFGLDAFLGTLLPGAGDALGGVTALSLIYVAWRRGAPRELLLRMLGNASADVVFGSIPIVGDVFDLGFHANRRNLTLVEDFLRQRSSKARASRITMLLSLGLLVLMMLVVMGAAIGLVVFSWREWVR